MQIRTKDPIFLKPEKHIEIYGLAIGASSTRRKNIDKWKCCIRFKDGWAREQLKGRFQTLGDPENANTRMVEQ